MLSWKAAGGLHKNGIQTKRRNSAGPEEDLIPSKRAEFGGRRQRLDGPSLPAFLSAVNMAANSSSIRA